MCPASMARLSSFLAIQDSKAGLAAQVGGAAIVALVSAALHVAPFIPVLFGGVAGSLADSLLGANAAIVALVPAMPARLRNEPARLRQRDDAASRPALGRQRRGELRLHDCRSGDGRATPVVRKVAPGLMHLLQ